MKKSRFRYELLILTERGFYNEAFSMNTIREAKGFLERNQAYVAGRPVRLIDTKTGTEKSIKTVPLAK